MRCFSFANGGNMVKTREDDSFLEATADVLVHVVILTLLITIFMKRRRTVIATNEKQENHFSGEKQNLKMKSAIAEMESFTRM